MKHVALAAFIFLTACQTSRQQACQCGPVDTAYLANQIEQNEKVNTRYMSTDDKIALATELLNNDASEQALDILESVPTHEQNSKFVRLKRDAINKTVINLRYKVRILYEKSLQQTGSAKVQSLKQSKEILQNIIKKYPEYNDMYAVKNNLKQIERELSRRTS